MDKNDELDVVVHNYAIIHGTEHLTSVEFKRSISRDNKYIRVQYGNDSSVRRPWVGEIQRFVRFKVRSDAGRLAALPPLRIALCNFFLYEEPLGTGDEQILRATRRKNLANPKDQWNDIDYVVGLNEIDSKLMYFKKADQKRSTLVYDQYYFKLYSFHSKINN